MVVQGLSGIMHRGHTPRCVKGADDILGFLPEQPLVGRKTVNAYIAGTAR